MNNTTRAWLLRYPVIGYCLFALLVFIAAYLLNREHLPLILNYKDETSNFIFYFWIVIWPLILAKNFDSVGGIIFMIVGTLCSKAMTLYCYFTDSSVLPLTYAAVIVDLIATIWFTVRGVQVGKWTFANRDEVIPRRMKWRNSKVDVYSLSLRYSINRGIAYAFCGYNCIVLFLLFVVIR